MNQTLFRFGVDYYPEQWPESRWPLDADLMAAAGFNVTRLAEFAWSRLEVTPGQFNFEWLDRAIDILRAKGIDVVLGTPTASPPPWIMHAHPEIFRVLEDGRRQTYGNRRNYCPNNPDYRAYSRSIVTAMVKHYAQYPGLIGWQIDNELGQGDRCCCPVCINAFQDWLRNKYGTLDVLNQTWGTTFWSQIYTEWDQIPAPFKTGDAPNPSLALDYYRFASHSYVSFQKEQIEIIRSVDPQIPITHNLMGSGFGQLDYRELARDLDFVAWDNYPRMQWTLEQGLDANRMAFSHRLMRGMKNQNFWVMEQQAGQGGWQIVSVAPRPGELRLWAYQSIAHGADGVVFFRWRTARHGTEQYWHGLLDHHVRPTRRYEEIKRMGQEIKQIAGQLLGAAPVAEAAILYSYDIGFAFQIQANNPGFDYNEHATDLFRAFSHHHIPLDVIAPDADMSRYRLVIAPALHLLTLAVAEKLAAFVEGGGTLVVTPRSGVKDEFNVVVDQPLPGLLSVLCGVEVMEYDSLPSGAKVALHVKPGVAEPDALSDNPLYARHWCDVLRPLDGHDVEIIATYAQEFYAGQPAITLHQTGRGRVITFGTLGSVAFFQPLVRWIAQKAGIQPAWEGPAEVEVSIREKAGQRFAFVLNHSDSAQTIQLKGIDLISGQTFDGQIDMAPKDVYILTSLPNND